MKTWNCYLDVAGCKSLGQVKAEDELEARRKLTKLRAYRLCIDTGDIGHVDDWEAGEEYVEVAE